MDRLADAVHRTGGGGGPAKHIGGKAGALSTAGAYAEFTSKVLEAAGAAPDGFMDLLVRDALADAYIHGGYPRAWPLLWMQMRMIVNTVNT
jgi:hypothetical protein